jgi:hypothetical protein
MFKEDDRFITRLTKAHLKLTGYVNKQKEFWAVLPMTFTYLFNMSQYDVALLLGPLS